MKVLVLGAGGAASNGFARALKLHGGYELVGANCNESDLLFSECESNHLIPPATDWPGWRNGLMDVLHRAKPDFVHAQNDTEVKMLGKARGMVRKMGANTFLPDDWTIRVCQDKWLSYEKWRDADIPVPFTQLVQNEFQFNNWRGAMWLRPRFGAGGQGSLHVKDHALAARHMRSLNKWGFYTVAEVLTSKTVTVQQLYWQGHLVSSQQRTRASWANAGSTTTGVSGSTGIGVTSSDVRADEVADAAVQAVCAKPHGLFGVDMAYREDGMPCPTEINIGRFFTTAPEFYARAGHNQAHEYVRIASCKSPIEFYPVRNPLRDGHKWLRAMDCPPVYVAA